MLGSLVSVVITTYNSSNFVVEALDSVAIQAWKELELIITDDCSVDDTQAVCRLWLKKNGHRFVRTDLLTVERNAGISANANRGLQVAKGEWIKFLAVDDSLKVNCIEDNMSYIARHPEIRVLFSKVEVYRDTFSGENLIKTIPDEAFHPESIMAPDRDAKSQYKMLLLCDRIHFTPSVFLHRETLLSIGGFDERFKRMEDYPLWLKLTRGGHRLHFMDKVTVNYRQHSGAVNNTTIDYLIKPNYFETEAFRKEYIYPNLPWDIRWNERFRWYGLQVFRCNWLNRNRKLNRLLMALFTSWMNPFKYYIYFKKRIVKNLKNKEFY